LAAQQCPPIGPLASNSADMATRLFLFEYYKKHLTINFFSLSESWRHEADNWPNAECQNPIGRRVCRHWPYGPVQGFHRRSKGKNLKKKCLVLFVLILEMVWPGRLCPWIASARPQICANSGSWHWSGWNSIFAAINWRKLILENYKRINR
jgi:hypothetical protein